MRKVAPVKVPIDERTGSVRVRTGCPPTVAIFTTILPLLFPDKGSPSKPNSPRLLSPSLSGLSVGLPFAPVRPF